MEKVIIVSTNNNPDYYFYSPYIKKAWNTLGWKVAVMITPDVDSKLIEGDYIIQLPELPSLRRETLAQAGRLYAANYFEEERLLMTSDMDLLPLKDYWQPEEDKITNYGHDLTDHTFFPMGYTAMSVKNWKRIMNLTGNTEADMIRDALDKSIPFSPFDEKWEQWWNYDWSLLTKRLQGHDVIKILRGRRLGSCFAYGRVDRGDSMQIPQGETLIDAHCENVNVMHPDKLNKFISLFESVYGPPMIAK